MLVLSKMILVKFTFSKSSEFFQNDWIIIWMTHLSILKIDLDNSSQIVKILSKIFKIKNGCQIKAIKNKSVAFKIV